MTTPITILHLISTLGPGGAEVMLCNLVEGSPDGFRHVIVTTSTANTPSVTERITKSAAACHHLATDSILSGSVIKSICEIVHQEQPQIIQTWLHKADLAGAIVGQRTGVPVVWGLHSLRPFALTQMKALALNSALAAASRLWPTKIISCSQRGIMAHARRGYPKQKMVWIGNGIDTNRFQPNANARETLRASLGIPNDATVIGFVGRDAPVKDFPTFLDAAALHLMEFPNTHFVCCGTPPAAAAAFPATDHIHFIPFRQDMHLVYPAFDFLTLTSLSEAFPMVLIEAMACGVGCTATDVGDAALIIGDQRFIAPVGDASKISETWKARRLAPADATRQRAAITERFSLPATVGKYTDLYQSILSTPSFL